MPGLLYSSPASDSPAPVLRKYPERNWIGTRLICLPGGGIAGDNLPGDETLVLDTAQGPVAVAGCSHAGIVNILDYARAKVQIASIQAAIGGFHLFAAREETLAWPASKCKELILQNLLGAHRAASIPLASARACQYYAARRPQSARLALASLSALVPTLVTSRASAVIDFAS